MSKRAAEIQLTQDNVDELDECTDEPGQFEVASEEQLKQRVIKKAKRNKPLGDMASTGTSIFAGLKASQPFILERKPLSNTTPGLTIGSAPTTGQLRVTPLAQLGAPPAATTKQSPAADKASPYLTHLKALNESVSDWIRKHVTKDPHVDLTPIFKDYQTHLANIETKYKSQSEEEDSQDSQSRASETEETTEDTADEPDSPAGSQESQTSSQATQGETPAQSTEDDEDSLLSVRAKLFYKKGTEYCELGIGTLKVQNSGEKAVRLLLRNDTSVGKILLNVRVTSDILLSSKNNNVFVVCVANPPLTKQPDNSPVSYLVRVKTAQMAENLLSTIQKNIN